MRGIAEQETAPGAEARGASVMDAIGGEPRASTDGKLQAGFTAQGRKHFLEGHVVTAAQVRRQDADDAPVVVATHGKKQMEGLLPQEHVELRRDHAAGGLHVRHVEDMLVRCTFEGNVVEGAHRAVRSVATSHPASTHLPGAAVGTQERRSDMSVLLPQGIQRRIPLDALVPVAQAVAHDAFVVVLTQHQDAWIRREPAAGIDQRHLRGLAPLRP